MNQEKLSLNIEIIRDLISYTSNDCDPKNPDDFVTYSNLIMNAENAINDISSSRDETEITIVAAYQSGKDEAERELVEIKEFLSVPTISKLWKYFQEQGKLKSQQFGDIQNKQQGEK